MDGFTGGIIRHRRLVIALFLICTVVCAVLFLGVEVNYDLTDYLPEDAESTVALDLMLEEFGSGIPNTRVMAVDLTIAEALELKEEIAAAPGCHRRHVARRRCGPDYACRADGRGHGGAVLEGRQGPVQRHDRERA